MTNERVEQHCHLVAINTPRHIWSGTRGGNSDVCTFCWIIAEGKWFGRGLISGFISEGLFSVGTYNYKCRNDHLLQHIILFIQKYWQSFLIVVILVADNCNLCHSPVSGDQNTCVRERPSQ